MCNEKLKVTYPNRKRHCVHMQEFTFLTTVLRVWESLIDHP
jgi:hypothetical protein